jgi:hypothetical protein
MKIFSLKLRLLIALPVFLSAGHPAFAQVPGTGVPTGVNAAFAKLFGAVNAFTAKLDTRMIDPYHAEIVRMPMDFAVLDTKVRLEINLAQLQSPEFSPAKLASLKQAGMDRMTTVFRPDKKATYVIYPGVQSYQELPMAKGDVEAFEKGLTLEKTAIGKDTVDGHPCVKNEAIVKGDKGPLLEAVTWNATDLKDFPLQVEMKQKEYTVRMNFTQVRFAKPDAKQFDLPANYGQMK